MEKQLVKVLLRVVQSPEERFAGSKSLRGFLNDYNIGWVKGVACCFDGPAKTRIRELLKVEGISPDTPPDAWEGLTRAECLALGRNEKWSGSPARRDRLAIKTLPGRPLRVGNQSLILPPRCHLEADALVIGAIVEHETVLLVENWECFDRIHEVRLDFSSAGPNPLVLWRGGSGDVRANASQAFMGLLKKPVWAFVDYDPAGLLIAATLPWLEGVIAPEPNVLAELLQKHGLHDRYRSQLPQAAAALDQVSHPAVASLWPLLRQAGRALPQEIFI
ncbi:MAG TPA: hypothetical protein VMW15_16020 [Terracidiphilus sp.]|nr:hypothetical protein [Terracidiphilus sp.]